MRWMRASPNGRPMTWKDVGRRLLLKPQGSATDGKPVTLPRADKRTKKQAGASSVPSAQRTDA